MKISVRKEVLSLNNIVKRFLLGCIAIWIPCLEFFCMQEMFFCFFIFLLFCLYTLKNCSYLIKSYSNTPDFLLASLFVFLVAYFFMSIFAGLEELTMFVPFWIVSGLV
ncbi:hypothetical protein TDIS_0342 [Thermosulfurimonas dismutans]|uniref:Phosphatidate cytidylyltransferase n=1 Tax=Thermosulfurimonas dismutans TaxID=999894 RepID=A0A179D6V5_9BACT|nr:hypothetical protein TDIS_0342 [Thermosulfurimonas dismutans]